MNPASKGVTTSKRNCCVVGCSNTEANSAREVKFYLFPNRPWEQDKRQKWINAVNRNNQVFSKPQPCSPEMSIFTKKHNPITGRDEWELQNEDYDYHQEIARSAFADMLHDTERNQKYYTAVKAAVAKMHNAGKKANVLDIGTGTGLLAMMAAKCGADTIVACEAFEPMAECAEKVIEENGFKNRIQVFHKRSTDLTVGLNGDMKHRANILVTEVFDTELIGEGAISTFTHAHASLLEKDCIVVPSSGTVYAQVVESSLAQQWNKLNSLKIDNTVLLETPDDMALCPGATAVHDIQLSQFPENSFKTIIPPQPVFRFDWSGKTPIPKDLSNVQVLRAVEDGVAQVVFMWWDLVMDADSQLILSCAPVWAHPLTKKNRNPAAVDSLPWRDHWMQAVYYLPQEVKACRGEELTLISCHDEYSLWFNLRKDLRVTDQDYLRPICICGVHVAFARTRIGAMNDTERNRKYLAALKKCISEHSICLCLSNGTLLGLGAAKLGAKHVFCVEENNLSQQIILSYIKHNKLQDKVTVLSNIRDLAKKTQEVTLVFGEPHFLTTLLPWHNTSFWYLKQEVTDFLAKNSIILPSTCTVWAMAVEFQHLWKIRSPLHNVEEFSMIEFDHLITRSSAISDSLVEAQPLWEYPCYPLSEPFEVLKFDFAAESASKLGQGKSGLSSCIASGTCHGIVIWVDWDLDGNLKNIITTGPLERPEVKKKVKWDMHTRQGVYFFSEHRLVNADNNLKFLTKFNDGSGDVLFDFEVSES